MSARWQPQLGVVLGYWGRFLFMAAYLLIPSYSLVLAESASLLYRVLNIMHK